MRAFRSSGRIWGREYALYGAFPLNRAEQDAIRQAAGAIWRIYARVAPLLRSLPDEALGSMGLPQAAWELARLTVPGMPETLIGRLDMLPAPGGFKMLEFNTDTPTFVLECHAMNGLVCGECGAGDVNRGEDAWLAAALGEAVRASRRHLGKPDGAPALVAFTSLGEDAEDRGTVEYLRGLLDLPAPIRNRFVALEELRIDAEGLYDCGGDRIDVLYRLYPVEFFARDRDPRTGAAIGEQLFQLVCRKKVALINPPSAFLLQSKAVQALIWGLLEEQVFFDAEERELIRRHFLPTYLDPVFADAPYVVKPVLGREGNSVSIVDPAGGPVRASAAQTYKEQPMIYQKFVPMPQGQLMTEEGRRLMPLLTSCFVAGGRAGAIGLRAGGPITDDGCRFVPVCEGVP